MFQGKFQEYDKKYCCLVCFPVRKYHCGVFPDLITPAVNKYLSGALNGLKKIGLIVKENVEAINQADKFEAWLVTKGVSVIRRNIEWPDHTNPECGLSCASPDLYCVFALGGDGTFLSAVRWMRCR